MEGEWAGMSGVSRGDDVLYASMVSLFKIQPQYPTKSLLNTIKLMKATFSKVISISITFLIQYSLCKRPNSF